MQLVSAESAMFCTSLSENWCAVQLLPGWGFFYKRYDEDIVGDTRTRFPEINGTVNKMHSHAQQSHPATDTQKCEEDAAPNSSNCNDTTRSTTGDTSAAQMWYKSPPPRTGEVNCQIGIKETEYLLHQREAIYVFK